MNVKSLVIYAGSTLLIGCSSVKHHTADANYQVSDEVILHQRDQLSKNTIKRGFGPQSPRNIDRISGTNKRSFNTAPPSLKMNLCNIHFHRNAEHQGGEFSEYAGNGDGHGFNTGYKYTGRLTQKELSQLEQKICPSAHGALFPGDTIEVHYVYSTGQVSPGPTLGSCLSESIKNPQLRVETQVYILVNDKNSLNFKELSKYGKRNSFYQALKIPSNTGKPIQYAGSTTGPSYNEVGSPFQVTWSVRPKVAKVNIKTLGDWCKGNVFNEDHAHGVRNLVKKPELLSK